MYAHFCVEMLCRDTRDIVCVVLASNRQQAYTGIWPTEEHHDIEVSTVSTSEEGAYYLQ